MEVEVVPHTTVTALYLHQAELEVAVDQHKHMAAQGIPAHITEMVWAVDLLLILVPAEINIIMAAMPAIIQVVAVAEPMVMPAVAGLA